MSTWLRALLASWQSSTQPSFSIIRSTLDSFEFHHVPPKPPEFSNSINYLVSTIPLFYLVLNFNSICSINSTRIGPLISLYSTRYGDFNRYNVNKSLFFSVLIFFLLLHSHITFHYYFPLTLFVLHTYDIVFFSLFIFFFTFIYMMSYIYIM